MALSVLCARLCTLHLSSFCLLLLGSSSFHHLSAPIWHCVHDWWLCNLHFTDQTGGLMFSASLSPSLSLSPSSVILCLLFSLVLLDRMFSLPVFRLLCRDMFLFYAFLFRYMCTLWRISTAQSCIGIRSLSLWCRRRFWRSITLHLYCCWMNGFECLFTLVCSIFFFLLICVRS